MIERKVIENVIGKGFADKLDEVLINASEGLTYTKREMVEELGCANFIAAHRLNKALKKLVILSPSKLYKTDPFSLIRVKGIGEAAMFVAMCILDSHKYDVEKWWGWDGTRHAKFSSYQAHAKNRASRNGKHQI